MQFQRLKKEVARLKVTCISKFYDIEAQKERNVNCSFEVSKERSKKLIAMGFVKEVNEPAKERKESKK